MAKPKILVLDIETAPITAYVWKTYNVSFIGPEQIIEPGRTICWAAKWVGKAGLYFMSEWDDGTEEMLYGMHELLEEADAVVTYNGDRFDLPKLNGEFLLAGITPPPPPTSIDVLKTVRKMGFSMNKLAHVGPLMDVGAKLEHEGFSLWAKVLDDDPKAQRKMQTYNEQDVVLLEKVYKKLRPFIRNHPHLGDTETAACGACGSGHLQRRGHRRTKAFSIVRLQCQTCGAWCDGKRTKIKARRNG